MKRLLIASAALALIGVAPAFAQSTTPSSTMPPGATGATPSAPQSTTSTTPDAASATPSTATGDSSATAAATSTMPSSSMPASASAPGPVVGDLAQANPPPSSYPPCTTKKQDRCVAKGRRHAGA